MNRKLKTAMLLCIGLLLGIEKIAAVEITPPAPECWPSKVSLNPLERSSDYPYITSDTFRSFADFIIDETMIPIDPALVKKGDILYVNAGYLSFFFRTIHPLIHNRYILVSHFGYQSLPGPFASFLKDDTLGAWFCMNLDHSSNPKMHNIPLGLPVKNSLAVNPAGTVADVMALFPLEKKYLLYMNYHTGTNSAIRGEIDQLFKDQAFCYHSPRRAYKEYLLDLAASDFVLSPQGAGIDCYRTWEAMLMGSIPIVKSSTIDPIFNGLPILIVNDWKEITEEFLVIKRQEIRSREYNIAKLFADYWFDKIKSCQIEMQESP